MADFVFNSNPNREGETGTNTDTDVEKDTMVWLEPPWRVLIHNDDATTFEFVERILVTLFKLSHEIAEHIAVVTHIYGIALVCVRPRSEAEKLVGQAIFAARMEGFPLMLTCEPDE
jgi:ATP-dependent Clp protease adaptor protein ClpS